MSVETTDSEAVEKLRENLRGRLKTHRAPFHVVDDAVAAATIEKLTRTDADHWAATWTAAAEPFEARAKAAEAKHDDKTAHDNYLLAYGFFHIARFPAPLGDAKYTCYLRSVEMYQAAGRYFSPPLEVITLPFPAKNANEGKESIFYVRRQKNAGKQPVLIRCGGVDTWKEERNDYNDACIAAGFAQINIDAPGVGQAPLLASIDAERVYLPMLDWIRTQPDLDADRVVFVGMSYGGYWSTKVAHCYHDRFAGVVNWGGAVDRFWSAEWARASVAASSYLMDLGLARARTTGDKTYEDYIKTIAGFSLLEQGWLDKPHAPMLILNGRHDEQVPFEDMIVLLEHGQPKMARFFPGGHMGYGPTTFPTVLAWVKAAAGL